MWPVPITILIAILPALSRAFFGLALMQKMLDIFSMIGIIMLVGLVVKNSIPSFDHTMHEIRAGYDRKMAICNAGAARLRPILMTMIAMIVFCPFPWDLRRFRNSVLRWVSPSSAV